MAATEEGTRAPSPPADLEELLTYDDLFLEYFNAFLALPAFPLRLRYDRLRGQLRELRDFPQELPGLAQASACSPRYGATDEERERSLGWLIRERAQLFQRTALYLEYKLAKLLIRPLAEGPAGSRHGVRGCSRQSNGTTASSLPSRPSAPRWPTGIPSCELPRPLRWTRSTPAHLVLRCAHQARMPPLPPMAQSGRSWYKTPSLRVSLTGGRTGLADNISFSNCRLGRGISEAICKR
nr:PREDICTED: uncharacterized protein LOC104151751 [Struthio camelus australis]